MYGFQTDLLTKSRRKLVKGIFLLFSHQLPSAYKRKFLYTVKLNNVRHEGKLFGNRFGTNLSVI